jgi:hypothetical protein
MTTAPASQRTRQISTFVRFALAIVYIASSLTFITTDTSLIPLLMLPLAVTVAALVVRAVLGRRGRGVAFLTALMLTPFIGALATGFADRFDGTLPSKEVCMGIVNGYSTAVPCANVFSFPGFDPAALFDRSIAFPLLYAAIALYIAFSPTTRQTVRAFSVIGLLLSAALSYGVSSNPYGWVLVYAGGFVLLLVTGILVTLWAFAATERAAKVTGQG